MNLFVTSDLHLYSKGSIKRVKKWVKEMLEENDKEIDAIVVTGDIFEPKSDVSPYKDLQYAFDLDLPIICCLGNHEFFFRGIDKTLAFYKEKYKPEKYNVHYLDIIDHYDIGKYRFLGNVLWFDGSTATITGQDISSFADGGWPDKLIPDFDWGKECDKCIDKIINSRSNDLINVLCTHCVPHKKLNGHLYKHSHPFNAYSGVDDLLERCKFDYSFCGHTHYRLDPVYINGCRGENVGCGKFYPLQYSIVEI
jgi:predicted MPP superfamily phosphohydrolase